MVRRSILFRWLKEMYYQLIFRISSRNKLKNRILSPAEKKLVQLQNDSYLSETGWINSAVQREVMDREGNALPWMTYPFIHFLEGRLDKDFHIFEYGSGQSTLYFAKRVQKVISVEHDMDWYNAIKEVLPQNVSVHHKELVYGGEYARFILSTDQKFDLVIIDGRDRVNCCYASMNALKDKGVIILDNADRKAYGKGIQFLKDKGFRQLDFCGMAPKSPQMSCTAVFYRADNCLNI